MDELRVALVTPWDVEDIDAWSGMIHPIRLALGKSATVVDIPATDLGAALVDRAIARGASRLTGGGYPVNHAAATSIRRGRALRQPVAGSGADVVLGIAASNELAFLRTPLPIVSVSDATLAALLDFYPGYFGWPNLIASQGKWVEGASWRKSARCLISSDWARRSLISEYGIDPRICRVVPFGPGVQPTNVPRRELDAGEPLRLLAVVRNWQRKRGDVAVEVLQALSVAGVPATLSIVGNVPVELNGVPGVRELGRLARDTMGQIYLEHDVLLDFASANASAVTLTDAAAFALPVVATAVGGVETIVADGITGFVVPPGAQTVASAVERLRQLREPVTYAKMSSEARARHSGLLNWDRWATATLEQCRAVVAERGTTNRA